MACRVPRSWLYVWVLLFVFGLAGFMNNEPIMGRIRRSAPLTLIFKASGRMAGPNWEFANDATNKGSIFSQSQNYIDRNVPHAVTFGCKILRPAESAPQYPINKLSR